MTNSVHETDDETAVPLPDETETAPSLEQDARIALLTSKLRKSETALYETASQYLQVFSAIAGGVILQNARGDVELVNADAERILGWQNDLPYGLDLTDERWRTIREDGVPLFMKDHPVFRTLKTGVAYHDIVLGLYKPDDSLTWIALHTVPLLHDDDEAPFAVVITFRDVTEERHVAAELRAREQLLVQTQTLAGMASFELLYPDGVCTWSQETTTILGLLPGNTLGTLDAFFDCVYEADREQVQVHFGEALAYGTAIHIEYRIVRQVDGEIRYIESIGAPAHHEEPRKQRIVGTIHDITPRKTHELALRQSEARYRTLARNLPDTAVLMYDHDLRFLIAEGLFLERLPFPRAVVEHRTFYEVLPEETQKILLPHYMAPLRGEMSSFERELPDGIIYQGRGMPVYDDNGEVIAGLMVSRDVTGIRQRELELQDARDMAEAANRARSIFLASISHELRTPLNAILGFSQILQRDSSLMSDHQEQIKIIDRSGRHLLRLINQVLDVSRIEAGQSRLKPESLNLYALIDDVTEMMRGIALQKNLTFTTVIQPDVPEFIVLDGGKLKRVLVNLLDNAMKYTDRGNVNLVVDADAEQLKFVVQDTGRGIPQAQIETIFELYSRASMPQFHSDADGAGLGLPLSHSFVEMMGGEITLTSDVGRGTYIAFTVLYDAGHQQSVRETQRAHVLGLATPEANYRILVVEDRAESRLLLVNLLQSVGYEVEIASNGRNALEIAQTWEPHLVLMDMRMPVMDGYEATRQLKKWSNPPVVIGLSGNAVFNRAEMMEAGCDDVIEKPFEIEDIFQCIKDHLKLDYVYATRETKSPVSSLENLALLPEIYLRQLYAAVVRLHTSEVLDIIDEIEEHDKITGITLRNMVEDFRYDRIRQMLKEILDQYG